MISGKGMLLCLFDVVLARGREIKNLHIYLLSKKQQKGRKGSKIFDLETTWFE